VKVPFCEESVNLQGAEKIDRSADAFEAPPWASIFLQN